MTSIIIDRNLKEKLPEFAVGIISFICNVEKTNKLDDVISTLENELKAKYQLSDVIKIPRILAARNGYKKLGKDPSRYRLAVESLYRRIVKGNSLYRINDVVDIGNILSIKSKRSVAVLDKDKIQGDILFRIGKDEPYEGIGRGMLNIENIPVYSDDIGPFGCPTSDTYRTMIVDTTTNVLVFIISFEGEQDLKEDINLCQSLYEKYTNSHHFQTKIIT